VPVVVAVLVACLAIATDARAHAPDVPVVERASLVMRDGGVVCRARWRGTPSIAPAAASFRVRAGELDVGPLGLAAGAWRERRRGLRWRAADRTADGVTAARLTVRRRGDGLALAARGAALAPLADASAITVVFTIGDVRLCADFAAAVRRRGRVRWEADAPFAPCPCDDTVTSTWEGLQRQLIARHGCLEVRCHGAAPGSAGLDLTPTAAFDDLVGVPSDVDPLVARVLPGNPTGSMLWRKLAASTLDLEDVPGNSMPIGASDLDPTELDALARWITAGAPRTGSVPAADALLGLCPTP